jgi:hypothetical protein
VLRGILHFDADQPTRGFSAVDTQITIGNRRLVDSSGKGLVALLELNTRSVGWLPSETAFCSSHYLAARIGQRWCC